MDGAYFQGQLKAALETVLPEVLEPEQDVELYTTATTLRPLLTIVPLDEGPIFAYDAHRSLARFSFRAGSALPGTRPNLIENLARAGRASAGIPAVFEPVIGSPAAATEGGGYSNDLAAQRSLVDGGLLNNLPIEDALARIFEMPASRPVQRILLAVIPGYEEVTSSDPRSKDEPATAWTPLTVLRAAVSAQGAEDDAQALLALAASNDRVIARRSVRASLLDLSLDDLSQLADGLLGVYQTNRCEQSLATNYRQFLDAWHTRNPGVDEVNEDQFRAALVDTTATTFFRLPWIPSAEWAAADVCWGASGVRRAAAAALHICNLAADAGVPADLLAAHRDLVHVAIAEAASINPLSTLVGGQVGRAADPARCSLN